MTDPGQCNLFGRFGILVQLTLFAVCSLALLIKKHREKPRRKFMIFSLDLGKQFIAQIMIHCLNLCISYNVQHECSEYLFISTFDTVFGLVMNFLLLKIFNWIAVFNNLSYLVSGNYFTESEPLSEEIDKNTEKLNQFRPVFINYRLWFLQAMVWCSIVLISKILMLIAEMRLQIIVDLFHWMLKPLPTSAKIIFVLMIAPSAMNATMVWIQDNLLKKSNFDLDVEKQIDLSQFYEDENNSDQIDVGQNGPPRKISDNETIETPSDSSFTAKQRSGIRALCATTG